MKDKEEYKYSIILTGKFKKHLKNLKNRAFFETECRLRFNLSVLGYLNQGGFELTDKLKTKIEATIREYVEDLKRELESL